MSTTKTGIDITVAYGGHNAEIRHCDIFAVAGALVIRPPCPVTDGDVHRPIQHATHHMSDHLGGFWRPDLGVFVVPEDAVTLLSATSLPENLKTTTS